MAVTSAPLYPHDCTNCRYLGTVAGYDIYVCQRSTGEIDSTIARYGAEGAEYASTAFLDKAIAAVRAECSGIGEDEARAMTVDTAALMRMTAAELRRGGHLWPENADPAELARDVRRMRKTPDRYPIALWMARAELRRRGLGEDEEGGGDHGV